MKKIKYFLPLVFFIVLGLFLLRGIQLDPHELPSPLIGKPVPSFLLPELSGERTLTPDDLKGRVFLLNVWATWCVSCKMEHPYLLQLARQGVVVIGLNYKDDRQKALQWLKDLGNPYAFNIADEEGRLGLDLGVFGAPETYLIDQQGIIRRKHVGVINDQVWETLGPAYLQLRDEKPHGP
jgi:cytochrome c biogenesis protein CcmG/thiol:disulfide interchange protein DsbE